jgi:NACalpha-BTF3-like transcription factor
MKRQHDTQFMIASMMQLEFPFQCDKTSEFYLNFCNKSTKREQIFKFSLQINKKPNIDHIVSLDDILSVTLSQHYKSSTKYEMIETNYVYWQNMMTKRLAEIQKLRSERIDMLEKMDHGDDDVSIEDIDFVTQQIKNHTIEVNDIREQSNDIKYEDFVGIRHIDLFCGQIKRVKMKEENCSDVKKIPIPLNHELFDIVWYIKNYEESLIDTSKFERIETISNVLHTLCVSKLRKK